MKVRRGYRSRNVEYRGAARGGGMRLPIPQSRGGKVGAGIGGGGLIGIILVVVIGLLSSGGGGFDLGEIGLDGQSGGGGQVGPAPEQDSFHEAVFDDVQNTWIDYFAGLDQTYPEARLVVFEDVVDTGGCGRATEQVGPFYCPADQRAYFDPDFFTELAGPRFGAPGDFAVAYVVAHEIGHHVQNVTGVSAEVRQQQQGASQTEANDLSIRLELQADCLAGIWAFNATSRPPTFEDNDNILYLERGDLEEGLAAAQAVGDDRIQDTAGAQVDPHKWNHGSARQRAAWLTLGMDGGNAGDCSDTFNDRDPGIEIMPR